jgi:molecular chaperone DnaJ
MSSEKRDYYEVLSVTREADGTEIKKAYRRLAMEYHPDRNPGDKKAEERFKELAEAYEILSNDEKRQLYDQYGHAGPQRAGFQGFSGVEDILSHFADFFGGAFGGGGRGGGRTAEGADLEAEVRVSLVEAARGVQKELTYDRLVACKVCQGSGAKAGSSPTTCGTCGGRGQVAHNQGIFMIATTCPSCRGRGQVIKEKCEDCRGAAVERARETVTVTVPPGIDEGQTLRLTGKGQAAVGGRPGHLYVHVRVDPDPRFDRHGDDLVTEVSLSYAQAAMGAKVKVPLVDGDPTELTVKPGTQPGSVVVLRGKGMPNVHGRGRGDLGVRLQVRVPHKLTDAQRHLIEELAKLDPEPAAEAGAEQGPDEADERSGFFFRKRKKR